MSDNPPRNKNSKFGAALLDFEGWYHLLSRNLCECLNQSTLCPHWTKVFSFLSPLPPQGRAPCQHHSWLWSLAGCLVKAHFVHSMARLQRGSNTTGERKCKPQVPDMNIPDVAAERPHYCHDRYCENKGSLFRIEGCVLLLVK